MTENVKKEKPDIEELADAVGDYKPIGLVAFIVFMALSAGLGIFAAIQFSIDWFYANIGWATAILTATCPMSFFVIINITIKNMGYKTKKMGRGIALLTLIGSLIGFGVYTPWIVNGAYTYLGLISMLSAGIVGGLIFWYLYVVRFELDWPRIGKKSTETSPEETGKPSKPMEVEINPPQASS